MVVVTESTERPASQHSHCFFSDARLKKCGAPHVAALAMLYRDARSQKRGDDGELGLNTFF